MYSLQTGIYLPIKIDNIQKQVFTIGKMQLKQENNTYIRGMIGHSLFENKHAPK